MTVSEFVEQLKQTGEVVFDRSRLALPRGVEALADPFIGVLPTKGTVQYGIEVSRLGTDGGVWSGGHKWWIVLDDYLVYLAADMLKAGQQGYELNVAHRFYRRAKVSAALLDVTASYPTSYGALTPESLFRFAQALMA
jgi:hypothetical protein